MKSCDESCSCHSKILLTCSGAADVGLLADRVTRELRDSGWGQMSCLAGLGAEMPAFLKSLEKSDTIVIDGCSLKCGSKICDRYAIAHKSFVITELGVSKGTTTVTEDLVKEIVGKIKSKDLEHLSC